MCWLATTLADGYDAGVNIMIEDKLLEGVELSPAQAVLDFAVGLFSERRVTLGRAASIARLGQPEFLQELGRRGIPIHYDLADLAADVAVVREVPPA